MSFSYHKVSFSPNSFKTKVFICFVKIVTLSKNKCLDAPKPSHTIGQNRIDRVFVVGDGYVPAIK